MRLDALRGAIAGCVGALALAAVLVLVPTTTAAERDTERSLERSGVEVLQPAAGSDRSFDDPGGSLRLAGIALAYGLVAGAVLSLAARGVGASLVARAPARLPLVVAAAAGLGLAVVVLAVAGHATGRELGAQAAFWIVTALVLARSGGGRYWSRASSTRRPTSWP